MEGSEATPPGRFRAASRLKFRVSTRQFRVSTRGRARYVSTREFRARETIPLIPRPRRTGERGAAGAETRDGGGALAAEGGPTLSLSLSRPRPTRLPRRESRNVTPRVFSRGAAGRQQRAVSTEDCVHPRGSPPHLGVQRTEPPLERAVRGPLVASHHTRRSHHRGHRNGDARARVGPHFFE